jgi:signal transduction histidine kinase
MVKRFGDMFDFAYDRFLELRDKEERAPEAELQASVDRVRAEAMAMAATDDIANVVKALWEGLVRQTIIFDTLVFRVEDVQTEELQMYVATLEGASGVTFPESYLLSRGMLDGVNLYRSTMPLEMAQLDFQEHRGLYAGVQEEVNKDLRALWGVELPDDLIARTQRVVVPFAYGQITIVREEEPFLEADLECAESFAEGVSLGFTRYFDFRQLEEQNVQLAEANVQLEEANEQIQEATRLKSQFLATMSHELRTPMNAIIGFTRLVLRRAANLEERQRDNLEKVQLSANHLLTLINDILDLSKVEAGRLDLKPTSFRVSPLIQQCCATVGSTLGKPGVELVYEIGDEVGEVFADEDRLRQVMANLLSNALKFTDGGEVKVRVQESGIGGQEMLAIAVSDTGIGIPEDQLGRIFEEFRQVDGSSTRKVQGTGLGLAITKRLIELMGGRMGVTSEVGKGSVFTVEIPLVYQEENE